MSRWLPKSYHDFVRSVWQTFRGVEEKTVRARTKKGTFVADDKSTAKRIAARKTKRIEKEVDLGKNNE